MKIVDYLRNIIECEEECPGCSYINHKFSLPCGIAYEDDICIVSQDWELPIYGMMIVTPKRHVEFFEEMTKKERSYILEIVNKVISILRKNGVSKSFNVLFEEKEGIHFHVWILPRDGWKEIGIDPTKDIRKLKEYALSNFRNESNFKKISEITKVVKNTLQK